MVYSKLIHNFAAKFGKAPQRSVLFMLNLILTL